MDPAVMDTALTDTGLTDTAPPDTGLLGPALLTTAVLSARTAVAPRSPRPGPMAAVITWCRRELGMSQEILAGRLAEVSGNPAVTREQVSRWERGKRIPGPYWRAWLSEVLMFPLDYLDEVARIARMARRESAEAAGRN